ncbi:MAG: MFS transporter [Flavobacteriales bacterium]
MIKNNQVKSNALTSYQILLIVLFVFIIFTIVVDYMTLPALSAILLEKLQITTKEFGMIVSAYAFSAGISAFLAIGFSDRFDRKKLLLVYYGGFLLGMLLCATANSFWSLIIARVISGAFGGVVAAIIFAMVADLFQDEQRGRVMGYVQMAFAASLIVGLPLALFLATHFNWRLSYWLFFGLGLVVLVFVFLKIKPVVTHLGHSSEVPFLHQTKKVLNSGNYWKVFLNNIFVVLGDAMFMTFSAAFATNNLGLKVDDLPIIYGAGGLATITLSPFIGRFCDSYGKLRVFSFGSALAIILIAVYSNLNTVPLWLVVLLHTLLFIGINARMIASTALATVVPDPRERGTFMALDSSLQQVAGGIAATAAGWIVFQSEDGMIHGFSTLGWTVIGAMTLTLFLMYSIQKMVERRK